MNNLQTLEKIKYLLNGFAIMPPRDFTTWYRNAILAAARARAESILEQAPEKPGSTPHEVYDVGRASLAYHLVPMLRTEDSEAFTFERLQHVFSRARSACKNEAGNMYPKLMTGVASSGDEICAFAEGVDVGLKHAYRALGHELDSGLWSTR